MNTYLFFYCNFVAYFSTDMMKNIFFKKQRNGIV